MPAALKAYFVRPEQSKLEGPRPPEAYGLPIWARAESIAAWMPEAGAGAELGSATPVWLASCVARGLELEESPEAGPCALRASRVSLSRRPVAGIPCEDWKLRTAARVSGPIWPSGVTPSACCASRRVKWPVVEEVDAVSSL